jgi:hypothetical protein
VSTVSESPQTRPAGAPGPGRARSGLSGAAPVLCGELVGDQVGPEPVEWVLWPVEVYASGAVLRVRLTPLGPWRGYDDASGALFRTVVPPGSWAEHHDEIVLSTAEAGPMLWVNFELPNPDVEPGHRNVVWNHSWNVEFWWPREDWLSPARLSWPARGVDVVLPVDPVRLEELAARCPAPPDITPEAHHPGFDVLPAGTPLGLEAHQPRAEVSGRAPRGGTQHWPHHDPDPGPDAGTGTGTD